MSPSAPRWLHSSAGKYQIDLEVNELPGHRSQPLVAAFCHALKERDSLVQRVAEMRVALGDRS
jgi:hypothetical protein